MAQVNISLLILGFTSPRLTSSQAQHEMLVAATKSLSFQVIGSMPVSIEMGWIHLLSIGSLAGKDWDWRSEEAAWEGGTRTGYEVNQCKKDEKFGNYIEKKRERERCSIWASPLEKHVGKCKRTRK